MNKLLPIAAAAALGMMTCSAWAMDEMEMKKMDANGDGMISKSEWTKYHDAMWGQMKKDKNGMVSVNDMGMMGSGMAKDDKMMKSDKSMKSDKAMQSGMTKDKGK